MTRGLFIEARLAVAVGRFNPDGPHGYRAATMPDAPLRPTRADAEHDELTWLNTPADECARDHDAERDGDISDNGDARWSE